MKTRTVQMARSRIWFTSPAKGLSSTGLCPPSCWAGSTACAPALAARTSAAAAGVAQTKIMPNKANANNPPQRITPPPTCPRGMPGSLLEGQVRAELAADLDADQQREEGRAFEEGGDDDHGRLDAAGDLRLAG